MPAKKTKTVDTAIIVAVIGLVGTIIAALLSSPLASQLFANGEQSGEINPTVETGTLVFSNDFESEQTSGFVFNTDQWQITREKDNKVL